MKAKNKLFCRLLLALTLIISVITSNVYASELKNSTQTINKDCVLIYQEDLKVDSNSGKNTQNISKREKDAIKVLSSKKINSKVSKVSSANSVTNSNGATSTKNSANSLLPFPGGISSSIQGTNTVTIHHSIYCNNTKRTIIDGFEITGVTGIRPTSLSISQFLVNSDIANPIMAHWYHDDIFQNLSVSWTSPDIYVGNSKYEEVPSETKYWGYFGEADAYYATGFMQGNSSSVSWSVPYSLVNRTGNAFPDYQDPWSKKKASDGVCTNWVKVDIANRVPWNGAIRAAKIEEYKATYGDPKWDWSLYDLHHIRPVAFGGTNDLSNLIPLPKAVHSTITGWFNGYSPLVTDITPENE